MNFAGALGHLNAGGACTRAGWNGPDQFIGLMNPYPGSDMTVPYIFIRTTSGEHAPWVASQTDILADDWTFADE